LRLTAIRSFFRMVALREPALVGLATRIVAIPMKRTDTKVRDYVTREEMDAVLAGLDRTHWCGRRDYALLLTMYNAGARVSEIAALRQRHIAFGPTCYVQLHGKGRKERSIPLWPKTAQILKEWFREIDARADAMAFPNVRRGPLTRFAIHLLLRKAVRVAAPHCPSLTGKRVSPHVIRHGTAMALLQAGVDIAVIAMWLGHESIETTNVYVHANLAMKEKALAKMQPMNTPFRRFRPDDRLLAFLEAL
jgi:integrase/recombinase XerD